MTQSENMTYSSHGGLSEQMKVKLTFTSEIVCSMSYNPNLPPDTFREEDASENWNVKFPRQNGIPISQGYQYRSCFKQNASKLSKIEKTSSAKLKDPRKVIAGTLSIVPRTIPFNVPEGVEIDTYQRPISGNAGRGQRGVIVYEMLPKGTTAEFTIRYLNPPNSRVNLNACIREWLDAGSLWGFGQFSTGGFGKFTWEEITS